MFDFSRWLSLIGIEDPQAVVNGLPEGFTEGLLLGALVPICLFLILKIFTYRRHRCTQIKVSGEQGDLYLTVSALREFITRVLCEFDQASMKSLAITKARSGLTMTIDIDVVPGAVLTPLRNEIQEKIMSEARARIGLGDMLKKVDIRVPSWSADKEKIARKKAKKRLNPPLDTPDALTVAEEEKESGLESASSTENQA